MRGIRPTWAATISQRTFPNCGHYGRRSYAPLRAVSISPIRYSQLARQPRNRDRRPTPDLQQSNRVWPGQRRKLNANVAVDLAATKLRGDGRTLLFLREQQTVSAGQCSAPATRAFPQSQIDGHRGAHAQELVTRKVQCTGGGPANNLIVFVTALMGAGEQGVQNFTSPISEKSRSTNVGESTL